MANRYGSGKEDFDAEAAALKRLRTARQELVAKEDAYQRSLAATEGLESKASRASEVRNRVKREGAEVAKREQAVSKVSTSGTNVDTAAIERNTAARRRNAALREKTLREKGAAPAPVGRDVIRHPTLYGKGAASAVDYTDLERRASTRVVTRQPVGERGAAGRYGGGNAAYDARFEKASANRATAAEAAASKLVAAEAKITAALEREAAAQRAASVAAREHALAVSQEQLADIRASQGRVDSMLNRQALAQRKATAATQASGVAYGSVSNAIRRHGALTTEFIAATARGESTLKELGNQSLATVGKFAGWTAAASAVYGAVGAIGKLKEGALAASSGVSELNRYVSPGGQLPGGASEEKKRFGELAQKYNLPVSVVTEAVAGQAKVFGGDLPKAFKAAETALAAVKVGELSAADATLSLTAIVNGFKLGANDLGGVLDSVNQAQQRFGGNTGDLVKGVGKAGGAFRNAGGDYKQLIALLVAGSRTTGATAENVATAIQRSVSSSLTKAGQERLKAVGIEPEGKSFPEIFAAAAKRVKGASPQEADRIARSLVPAGGQFTRILVPLLQNKDLVDKVFKEVSQNQKGSTDRELKAVLGKASEQIKAVGVNLEALGASIASSGALEPLGLMLKTLNLVLTTTNNLVKIFNLLPAPIRKSVTALAEIAGAIALLRRLGGADRFAGGALGFLANPDKRLKSYATKGLRDVSGQAKEELESASKRQFRAALVAESAETQARTYTTSPQFRRAQGLHEEHPERIAANAHAEELDQAQRSAVAKRELLARETQALTEAVKVHTEQLAVIEGATTRNIRERLSALQIAIPASLEVQNLEGIRRAPPGIGAGRAVSGAPVSALGGAEATRGAYSSLISAGQARDAQLATMARETNRLGYSGRGTVRAAGALKAAAGSAVGFLGRAASSLRGAGTGLKNLVAGFGLLDGVIIAFIAGQALKGYLEKKGQQITKAIDSSGREESESIRRLNQTLARNAGKPIPLQTGAGLASQIDKDAKQRQAGVISQAEFDRRRKVHAIELQHLYSHVVNLPGDASREQQKAAAEADIADQRRAQLAASNAARIASPKDFAKSLVGKTREDLDTIATATATQVGPGGKGLRQATQIYQAQVDVLGGSADPKDIAALDAARNNYFSLLQSNADKEIKSGLRSAGSESARSSVFAQQVSQIHRLGSLRQRAFASTQKAVTSARDDRDQAASASTANPGDKKLGEEAERTAKRYLNLRLRLNKLKQDLKETEARTREILQQIQDESYDDRSTGRDINAAYDKSLTRDPVAKGAVDVRRAAAQVQDATRTYGANSRKTKEAMTALNEAKTAQQDTVKQDANDTARLLGELAVARSGGDAVASAEAARSAARRVISSANTKDERLQGLIDLANANNELEQALRDREVARLDLLESKTTDPVQQSRIELQKAKAALKGTKGTARTQGQAAVNRARQAVRDASLSEKEGDIDFERSLGRISVQDAVDRYQSLLAIKNLTKQQKRDIQQKIHDLQSEAKSEASGFDLDVSGLKLPTVYDVRRSLDPIRQQYAANAKRRAAESGSGPGGNVLRLADYRGGDATQNIVINVTGGDPDAVYTAIDRALKTNVRAAVRARGRR